MPDDSDEPGVGDDGFVGAPEGSATGFVMVAGTAALDPCPSESLGCGMAGFGDVSDNDAGKSSTGLVFFMAGTPCSFEGSGVFRV